MRCPTLNELPRFHLGTRTLKNEGVAEVPASFGIILTGQAAPTPYVSRRVCSVGYSPKKLHCSRLTDLVAMQGGEPFDRTRQASATTISWQNRQNRPKIA
jgi:hypothetical protein